MARCDTVRLCFPCALLRVQDALERPQLHAEVSLGYSRGPLRELRLFDTISEGGGREGGGEELPPVGGCTVCEFKFDRLGISLIDEEPREVLYFALQEIKYRSALSHQLQVELELGHLQVESVDARWEWLQLAHAVGWDIPMRSARHGGAQSASLPPVSPPPLPSNPAPSHVNLSDVTPHHCIAIPYHSLPSPHHSRSTRLCPQSSFRSCSPRCPSLTTRTTHPLNPLPLRRVVCTSQ